MAFVYALILTAVVAAVLDLAIPEGRLSGAVKGMVGVCLIVILLTPIKDGILFLHQLSKEGFDFGEEIIYDIDYEGMLRDNLTSLGEKEVKKWVQETIKEVFGLSEEHGMVTVTMAVSNDEITPTVQHVRVLLSGSAILKNPHAIETYISEALGCECDVAVGKSEGG